jgi:adenylate cyclase
LNARSPYTSRRQLAAVWFADIAGFTRLSGRREDDALRVVELFQSAARAAVEEQSGTLVKFLGDGALALFSSAESAVRSALQLQSSFQERVHRAGLPAELRIGIHLADVLKTSDGDVYGDGVNAASRIVGAAEPGEVLVSEDVWRQARRRSELRFEERGPRPLEGIDEPIRLYAASKEAVEPAGVPPPVVEARREPRELRSIAVLPFADLSPEMDQQYFADGMAEELLNALARVSRLQVPARTSSFAFRGESIDVREIGSRLGVEAVLEGSVRKAGERLRITVQLIDASDGYHLWSDRYDRQMEDVFAIQEEIATSVVEALGLRLREGERRLIEKRPTEDFRAYDLYLRGREHYHRHTLRDSQIAEKLYRRAIESDPGFTRAWAGLADLYADRWTGKKDLVPQEAEDFALRALELDPDLAETHVSLGHVLLSRDRPDEAVPAFERALELDPNLYEAHYFYGRTLYALGRLEDAAERFARAHEARPDEYQAAVLRTRMLRALGREAEAREAERHGLEIIERHLEIHPDDVRAIYMGAGCLVTLGDHGRARGWLERALAAGEGEHWVLYNVACVYARLGDLERALDLLEGDEQIGRGGLVQRTWIANDSDLMSLHGHPRFEKLLARWEGPDAGSGPS